MKIIISPAKKMKIDTELEYYNIPKYLEKHLRIMSGFYGILKPFDGVTPYRLEMQVKLDGSNFSSLYEFWNKKLAEQLFFRK